MHILAALRSWVPVLLRRLARATDYLGAWVARRSIRSMVLLLLLIVMLPGIALQLVYFYQHYVDRREEELRASLEMARAVAAAYDMYIQGVLRQELAIGTALAANDEWTVEQMGDYLQKNAQHAPSVRHFGWISPEGVSIASAAPDAVGITIDDRPYFREILEGKDWAVSDLLHSRLRNLISIFVVRAIRDEEGNLHGVVLAAIDPERMAEALRIQRGQEGAIAIMDRQGRRVYRYPEVKMTWEQRLVPPNDRIVLEALTGRETTGIFDSDLTGDRRIAAAVPVSSIGWVAATGRPEEEIVGPLRADLVQQLTLLTVVAMSALAAALALSRSLIGPIGRLQERAAAVGRHDLDQQVTPSGPVELQELADAFNGMAAELRHHQQQQEMYIQMMSHDLRTPLTSLLGHAQLLQRAVERAGLSESDRRKAADIVMGAKRMDTMIQDLVDSARIEAGQFRLNLRPVQLAVFVAELKERLTGLQGVERIRLAEAPALPSVLADPDRLERVCTNLLSNALKYSTPGTEILVRLAQREGEVLTIVEDRGPGIAPEDMANLFQQYRRTRRAQATQEGLGLGLYISRKLVEAQDGHIWAESVVGQGSRFCFSLPVSPAAARTLDGGRKAA